jgi:predicted transcriptional regulator
MANQTDHIGDTNKMVDHHIVDTNKMITAVEWFYQRILAEDIKAVFKQAKAMEKEQIIDAFDNGCINHDLIGKEYYNETYNK